MTKNKFLRFVVTALMLSVMLTLTAIAAIEGGMGTIKGADETYKAAPAVINAKGDGLSVDTAKAIVLSEANNTGLAGIYAVSNDDFATKTYVYVYGNYADRKVIIGINTYVPYQVMAGKDADGDGYDDTYKLNKVKKVGTTTYIVAVDENGDGFDDNYPNIWATFKDNEDDDFYYFPKYQGPFVSTKNSSDFIPGYVTGKGCSNTFWGTWGYSYVGVTAGRNVSASLLTSFKSASSATAKKTAFDAIVNATKDFCYSYALVEKEIIPVSEVNRYTYKLVVFKDDNGLTNNDHKVKFEMFVADDEGNITSHTYIHNPISLGKTASTLVVDLETNSNGSWEGGSAPTEGYFVGFRVWPFYGLTDYTKFSVPNAAATNVGFVYSSTGYSIDAPKTPKPTGLSVDESGKIKGMVAGTTYEYVNLNNTTRLKEFAETGAASTDFVYSKVNDSTILTAGIWAVRIAENGEIPASDPAVLYVKGNSIANILHYDETTGAVISQNRYQGVGWRTICANGYRDIRHFTKGSWDGALGYDSSQGIYTLYDPGNFNLANWAPEYYFSPKPSSNSDSKYNLDYDGLVHAIESEYATYQYEDDEIIPFSMFESYTYKTNKFRCRALAKNGDVYTKFIFYVINDSGELEKREWIDVMNFNGTSATTHTVEVTDFDDTTGYIVAMEIHPTGYIPSTTTLTDAGGTNVATSFTITLVDGGYKIDLPKVTEGKPELTVNDTVVSGFDPELTYEYANLNNSDTLAGFAATGMIMAEPEYTTIAKGTESVDLGAGLWGIRVAGEEGVTEASDMAVVYVRGTASNILHTNEAGAPITEKYEGATGASMRAYTPLFKKGVWRGTLPPARSNLVGGNLLAFANDAYLTSVSWAGSNYNEGQIDHDGLIKLVESDHMTYQFTDDEVIPVDDFISYSYKSDVRQGSIKVKDGGAVHSTFTIYTVQEDGSVKTYEVTEKMDFVGRSPTTHTFTREDFGDATGYIVAIELRPTGYVVEGTELYVDPEYLVADAYDIHLISNGYVARAIAPTPELTSFPVIEGGHGNISGLKQIYLHEVRWSTDNGKTYTSWEEVPMGSTSFKVTVPGIYQLRVKDSDEYVASKIATVNVLQADAIDTFNSQMNKVYLTEDFVEVKADYEIDVTVKNWISTLSLQNLKEITPESTIIIVGDGFKYQLTAGNISVDDKIHYYNFDISFNGESRSDRDYKKFVEASGDLYVKNVYFESSNGLPFKNAELSIYVGNDYDGMELDSASYNERIDRLRYLEIVQVTNGWVTLTEFGEPIVLLIYED